MAIVTPMRGITVTLATVIAFAGTAGSSRAARSSSAAAGVLASWTEEGAGIAYIRSSLVVSTRRQAISTIPGRTVHFQLDRTQWRKLNTILKHTDLRAVAGFYPPVHRSGEYSTYVINAGGYSVRWTGASELPESVSRQVEPLRKVLREVWEAGGQRRKQRGGSPGGG